MTTLATGERWLTLPQAAERLEADYGLIVSTEYLKKLVYRDGAPSALNFGKRQVRLSTFLPWLEQRGIIER